MQIKTVLVSVLSALLISSPVLPATPATIVGRINSNGAVEVNGTRVPAGGTLFAGDRIITQKDTSAHVSLANGSQIVLVEASSVLMKDPGAKVTATLDRGSLAVLSLAPAPVVIEAGGARIHPGSTGAVYAVTLVGNNLQVVASKGTAEVEAGGRTVEVTEGKTLEATLASGPKPQGPGASGEVSTFAKILVITTAAASFTALGIAVKNLTRTCKATPSPLTVDCS